MASFTARAVRNIATIADGTCLRGDLSSSGFGDLRRHSQHGIENRRTESGSLRAEPDWSIGAGNRPKAQMVERETQVRNDGCQSSRGETDELRLLALEIRPRKAGFAVLEGATLLDWGVTTYGPGRPAMRRIASLLDLHAPSIIVTRRRPRLKNGQTVPNIVESIKSEARRRSIRFRTLDAHQVRAFFIQRGRRNKHAVATLLAEWFPELAWKLPLS